MDRNWNAAEKISFGVLAIFFFLTSIRLRKLNFIKVHKYDFFSVFILCFHFKIYENEIFLKFLKWGIISDLLCEVDVRYMPKPYNFTGESFVKNSEGNIQ